MQIRFWTIAATVGGCLLAAPAMAFQVMLDSGVGSVVILDNDAGDLNPDPGVIDFSTIVGGVFRADGRVNQYSGPPNRSIQIGGRGAGSDGVFANLDAASHIFTVTVETDSFTQTGPPLGWGVFSDELGDDTTSPVQGDVEIASNDLAVSVDPGDVLLTTASTPITPPVAPADQPVPLSAAIRGVDPAGAATLLRVTWSFTPGPFDELRLPDPSSLGEPGIIVNVFNAEDKCVFRMNRDAGKVANGAGVDDAKCVKTEARLGGDATTCVDDQGSKKTAKTEDRLLADFGLACTQPPAFGANLGTCCEGGAVDGDSCAGALDCPGGTCTAGACISGAAEDTATSITHDLFGPAVNVSTSATGRCQAKIAAAIAKLDGQRWSVLTECKRRNIGSLTTEADFVATCFGPPQPDPSGKIAKAEATFAKGVERDCLARGVTSLGTVFPGACAGAADGDYAACLATRVACRVCLGAVVADDVVSPLDCDLFDDGTANASCP